MFLTIFGWNKKDRHFKVIKNIGLNMSNTKSKSIIYNALKKNLCLESDIDTGRYSCSGPESDAEQEQHHQVIKVYFIRKLNA